MEDTMDVANDFGVSVNGNKILIIRPPLAFAVG